MSGGDQGVGEFGRFDDGRGVRLPLVGGVRQNDVLVQNHYGLQGGTFYETPPTYEVHALREPLMLQFHHNPTHFRNIWIRDLLPLESGSDAASLEVVPPDAQAGETS